LDLVPHDRHTDSNRRQVAKPGRPVVASGLLFMVGQAMNVLQFESREDWLVGRRKCIGSSDTPAILGLGYANQSKFSVYTDKTTDVPPRFDKATKARLDRGQIGERFVLSMFEESTGMQVFTNTKPTICMHPTLEFVGASLDAYVEPAQTVFRSVEAKLVMNREAWREWEGENPPLRHAIQVQHQLWCTGWPRGYLVGWTGDQVRIFEIDRNDEFLAKLEPILRQFWFEYVLPRNPPPIDGSQATNAALLRLFPKSEDYAIALGTTEEELIEKMDRTKARIKKLEAIESELANRLKLKLGDAAYGVCPNGRCVSWKSYEVNEYMVKAQTKRPLLFPKRLPKGVSVVPLVSKKKNSEVA
jgi:predicted phage-related endonuclease